MSQICLRSTATHPPENMVDQEQFPNLSSVPEKYIQVGFNKGFATSFLPHQPYHMIVQLTCCLELCLDDFIPSPAQRTSLLWNTSRSPWLQASFDSAHLWMVLLFVGKRAKPSTNTMITGGLTQSGSRTSLSSAAFTSITSRQYLHQVRLCNPCNLVCKAGWQVADCF